MIRSNAQHWNWGQSGWTGPGAPTGPRHDNGWSSRHDSAVDPPSSSPSSSTSRQPSGTQHGPSSRSQPPSRLDRGPPRNAPAGPTAAVQAPPKRAEDVQPNEIGPQPALQSMFTTRRHVAPEKPSAPPSIVPARPKSSFTLANAAASSSSGGTRPYPPPRPLLGRGGSLSARPFAGPSRTIAPPSNLPAAVSHPLPAAPAWLTGQSSTSTSISNRTSSEQSSSRLSERQPQSPQTQASSSSSQAERSATKKKKKGSDAANAKGSSSLSQARSPPRAKKKAKVDHQPQAPRPKSTAAPSPAHEPSMSTPTSTSASRTDSPLPSSSSSFSVPSSRRATPAQSDAEAAKADAAAKLELKKQTRKRKRQEAYAQAVEAKQQRKKAHFEKLPLHEREKVLKLEEEKRVKREAREREEKERQERERRMKKERKEKEKRENEERVKAPREREAKAKAQKEKEHAAATAAFVSRGGPPLAADSGMSKSQRKKLNRRMKRQEEEEARAAQDHARRSAASGSGTSGVATREEEKPPRSKEHEAATVDHDNGEGKGKAKAKEDELVRGTPPTAPESLRRAGGQEPEADLTIDEELTDEDDELSIVEVAQMPREATAQKKSVAPHKDGCIGTKAEPPVAAPRVAAEDLGTAPADEMEADSNVGEQRQGQEQDDTAPATTASVASKQPVEATEMPAPLPISIKEEHLEPAAPESNAASALPAHVPPAGRSEPETPVLLSADLMGGSALQAAIEAANEWLKESSGAPAQEEGMPPAPAEATTPLPPPPAQLELNDVFFGRDASPVPSIARSEDSGTKPALTSAKSTASDDSNGKAAAEPDASTSTLPSTKPHTSSSSSSSSSSTALRLAPWHRHERIPLGHGQTASFHWLASMRSQSTGLSTLFALSSRGRTSICLSGEEEDDDEQDNVPLALRSRDCQVSSLSPAIKPRDVRRLSTHAVAIASSPTKSVKHKTGREAGTQVTLVFARPSQSEEDDDDKDAHERERRSVRASLTALPQQPHLSSGGATSVAPFLPMNDGAINDNSGKGDALSFITGGGDGHVHSWSYRRGSKASVQRLDVQPHRHAIYALETLPSIELVVSASRPPQQATTAGHPRTDPASGHGTDLMAFDGRTSKMVRFWHSTDHCSKLTRTRLPHILDITSLRADYDQHKLYDLRAAQQPVTQFGWLDSTSVGALGRLGRPAFHGSYCIQGCPDGKVRMWDLRMCTRGTVGVEEVGEGGEPLGDCVWSGGRGWGQKGAGGTGGQVGAGSIVALAGPRAWRVPLESYTGGVGA
ncbi:hypothetical protein BDZ90DRAFT_230125 [Jaminaea rosea]|uniref:WD40 repeat-like protein n=1 Tax=Jaminaea rosea TaxID=1569628 RepID=A0A316V3M0_9BASI|nr:hypothetical protein BDZ90DRAFT_230125 [Jaminaea rosea]PWN31131.1 hypothetical protein BDZ90DRAFT_230125 [Jaminaea rosea]